MSRTTFLLLTTALSWPALSAPVPETHNEILLPVHQGRWHESYFPPGIGPVSREKHPGYLRGLAGGLLGIVAAPVFFSLEVFQAVALCPVRMLAGLFRGDWLALLDPVRTVKNLTLDSIAAGLGILNCASAPLWNAFRPDESTDFMYVDNRLVFFGGPIAGILKGLDIAKAIGPTWHTVFMTRNREKTKLRPGENLFEHEFVHNKQIARSFWFGHVGENYEGFEAWRFADAHTYLNMY